MHQRVSSLQLRRQRAPAVSPAYLLLLCLLLGPLPPSKRRCDAIDDVSGRRGDDAALATAVVVAGGLGLALAGNVDQQHVPHSDDDEDDDDGSDEDKFSDNELPVDNKSPTVTVFDSLDTVCSNTNLNKQTSPAPDCRALPPGEFNSMIHIRLPIYESFITIA